MPDRKVSAAELYGKGIFTTVALRDGRPFLWEKHWSRLTSNAADLGIDLMGHGESSTLVALLEAVTETGLENGRARLTFYDRSASSIWPNNNEIETRLSILVGERRRVPQNFRLTVSPHRITTTSPLAGIKSCNYLDHLLAYERATNGGFQEAIRLNERNEIASACMANVLWETDGELFTPSLKTGCLPGTTREYILENIECEEVEAGIEKLHDADRIFLTSAGIGVVCVVEAGGRDLDTSEHPLTSLVPF